MPTSERNVTLATYAPANVITAARDQRATLPLPHASTAACIGTYGSFLELQTIPPSSCDSSALHFCFHATFLGFGVISDSNPHKLQHSIDLISILITAISNSIHGIFSFQTSLWPFYRSDVDFC
jgi:hypothetical protein